MFMHLQTFDDDDVHLQSVQLVASCTLSALAKNQWERNVLKCMGNIWQGFERFVFFFSPHNFFFFSGMQVAEKLLLFKRTNMGLFFSADQKDACVCVLVKMQKLWQNLYLFLPPTPDYYFFNLLVCSPTDFYSSVYYSLCSLAESSQYDI